MIFLYAWLSMLLVGAAHSTNDAVPALGYWTVFLLTIAVRLALHGITTTRASDGEKATNTVVNQTINNLGKGRA